MIPNPSSPSGISGSVDASSGVLACAANLSRAGIQIYSWDVPLHVGFGSTPHGRVPDAIVPASAMWEPPYGLIPQQDVYVESSSGDASYHVFEWRR